MFVTVVENKFKSIRSTGLRIIHLQYPTGHLVQHVYETNDDINNNNSVHVLLNTMFLRNKKYFYDAHGRSARVPKAVAFSRPPLFCAHSTNAVMLELFLGRAPSIRCPFVFSFCVPTTDRHSTFPRRRANVDFSSDSVRVKPANTNRTHSDGNTIVTVRFEYGSSRTHTEWAMTEITVVKSSRGEKTVLTRRKDDFNNDFTTTIQPIFLSCVAAISLSSATDFSGRFPSPGPVISGGTNADAAFSNRTRPPRTCSRTDHGAFDVSSRSSVVGAMGATRAYILGGG